MLYLRLFHGRSDPAEQLDDWGSDGPVFGPYQFVHTTYTYHVKLGKPDGTFDELSVFDDMLYYGGVYYGDWSVFGKDILEESRMKTTPFVQEKAVVPESTKKG